MNRWIWPATVALAVAGLGVSVYLTVEHFTAANTLACPESSVVNCLKVTTSPQSTILGIPLAVLGLVFFVAIGVLALPTLWRSREPWVWWGRLALVGVGAIWVLYLLYVELFVVDAICLWCTAVHVAALALFVLTALRAAVDEA